MSDEDKTLIRPAIANKSRSVVRGHAMTAQVDQINMEADNRALKRNIEQAKEKIARLKVEIQALEDLAWNEFKGGAAMREVVNHIKESWTNERPDSKIRTDTFDDLLRFNSMTENKICSEPEMRQKFEGRKYEASQRARAIARAGQKKAP